MVDIAMSGIFVSPDPGNSLPGLGHGDIDADGNHEIYFGVAPAAGANDDTWGTYIFEQEGGVISSFSHSFIKIWPYYCR